MAATAPSLIERDVVSSAENSSPDNIELAVLHNVSQQLHESKTQPRIGLQLVTLYYSVFQVGFQDGTLGPLLPVIQRTYRINFQIVSLIFIFSCFGLLLGALANIQPGEKLGFGKVVFIGSVFQLSGYCMLVPEPPFIVMVFAYAVIGFGEALQVVQANAFVAAFGSNTRLGLLHAAYGTGALVSPLVATQFTQIRHWSFHWLVALGFTIPNVILLAWVFRLRPRNVLVSEPGVVSSEAMAVGSGRWRAIMSLKAVHALAFFSMVYCGLEITLGGWIITFIIDQRHGSASVGYVSSGFFGGLMVGRLALLWVNKKIGTRRVIFVYAILALSLEFAIWFIPSLIGNAIAVSFVGLFMGPMFPLVMNYAHLLLPPPLLAGSLGWIVGIGTAGVGSIPFLSGALVNKFGIGSLQPFIVIMMVVLICLWALVPNVQRRVE